MERDYEAEFQAAWDADEVAWEERVQAKMRELEAKALVLALDRFLAERRRELMNAESALCTAIRRVQLARNDCYRIAHVIEDASRLAGVA
jgi:hypothetical protein